MHGKVISNPTEFSSCCIIIMCYQVPRYCTSSVYYHELSSSPTPRLELHNAMTIYKWTPRAIANIVLVNGGLMFQSVCVVAAQLLSLFLWPVSEPLYRSYIAYTMRMWSQNLIALVQYFTPGTSLAITFDESCFAKDKKELLTVDAQGRITGLSLPEKAVVTANHQVKLNLTVP